MIAAHRPRAGLAWLASTAVTLGACASASPPSATSTTRPAAKTTCSEINLNVPSDFELVEQRLFGLDPRNLGRERRYRTPADDLRIIAISGGYLDDVLDAYDDLAPAGKRAVGGLAVEGYSGSFFGQPVFVTTWLDPESPSLCARRVVTSFGLDEVQAWGLVRSG